MNSAPSFCSTVLKNTLKELFESLRLIEETLTGSLEKISTFKGRMKGKVWEFIFGNVTLPEAICEIRCNHIFVGTNNADGFFLRSIEVLFGCLVCDTRLGEYSRLHSRNLD